MTPDIFTILTPLGGIALEFPLDPDEPARVVGGCDSARAFFERVVKLAPAGPHGVGLMVAGLEPVTLMERWGTANSDAITVIPPIDWRERAA